MTPGAATATGPGARPVLRTGARRKAGVAVAVLAVAGVAFGALLVAVEDRMLLVSGAGVLEPWTTSAVALAVAAVAAVVARGLLYGADRLRAWERGLVAGVVVLAVVAAVLLATGGWRLAVLLLGAAASPVLLPMVLRSAVVATLAVATVLLAVSLLRRRRPLAVGRAVVTAATCVAVVLVGGITASTALLESDVDTVVVRAPAGTCTIVVRQRQAFFSGTVTVYSGSGPVVTQQGRHHLEESFPFRDDDYTLTYSDGAARLSFDDGVGGVTTSVPCGT